LNKELKQLKKRPVSQITLKEIGHLQAKLSSIDARYRETKFPIGGEIPEGQATASELLYQAHEIVKTIQDSMPDFEDNLMDPFLRAIDRRLEKALSSLQRLRTRPNEELSFREIARIQNELHRIDELYREAKFENWVSKETAQRGHAYLAEKLDYAHSLAHDIVCRLPVEEGELVDQSLYKLSDNLDAITAQLLRLRDREFTTKEVGQIQRKLSQIDHLYKEGGKFVKGGKIPKGQAVLSEKLADAHEIAHQLLCSLPDQD